MHTATHTEVLATSHIAVHTDAAVTHKFTCRHTTVFMDTQSRTQSHTYGHVYTQIAKLTHTAELTYSFTCGHTEKHTALHMNTE